MATAPPEFLAAVDLGSNSFHMKVVRVVDGQLHVVDRMRERVRLAAGLDGDNQLRPAATERALVCLDKFGQRLRDMEREGVRAVGTNTLRRARNAPLFLADAEQVLGHPIDIIPGREEARLIYLGAAHSVAEDDNLRLVIDIGGGSTELVIGRGFNPLHMESLYMGCVGMSGQFFRDGKIRRAAMRDAKVAARQELEPMEEPYRRIGWEVAMGCSGTILNIERVIEAQGWSDEGITIGGLQKLRGALIEAGRVERLSLPGLQPERAPVFPGGVAILIAAFEALGIERMTSSPGALREGVLHDLLGRRSEGDAREATVEELCLRYHVDLDQAARVEKMALSLHDQAAEGWRLQRGIYGRLLSRAARLHEIGLSIAHNQHHKHGAYLLEHADLPGFARQEQALLAALVRSHRRKFRVEQFEALPGNSGKRVARLAVCLRLAVVLHRSRVSVPVPSLSVEDKRLRLEFPPGWLEDHPLTEADLRQEATYLKGAGLKLTVGG